jgi:5-methyltetrahydrofolate--homocysteine methyltransferase
VAWIERREQRVDRYRAALECAQAAAVSDDVTIVITIGPAHAHARAYWNDIELLLDEGVGRFACPTMTSRASAAAFAAAWIDVTRGTDAVATLSIGRLPSSSDEWTWIEQLPVEDRLRIGFTCCAGPEAGMRPAIDRLANHFGQVHVAPSAGVPGDDGACPWQPEQWSEDVRSVVDELPVASVGGCCGTTPDHIAALTQA